MKLKKNKRPIGREPLPYVTCRVCFEQIRHDGMFPSPLEAHFQKEHPEEYQNALETIQENLRGNTV